MKRISNILRKIGCYIMVAPGLPFKKLGEEFEEVSIIMFTPFTLIIASTFFGLSWLFKKLSRR